MILRSLSYLLTKTQKSADEKCQFHTFKVIFQGQKSAEIIQKKFSVKNIKLETNFY